MKAWKIFNAAVTKMLLILNKFLCLPFYGIPVVLNKTKMFAIALYFYLLEKRKHFKFKDLNLLYQSHSYFYLHISFKHVAPTCFVTSIPNLDST
jgi:hypothetical protein